MPPPDKFHDRWYLLGVILLAILAFVVMVALFE